MKNIKVFIVIIFSISTFITYGQGCSEYHIDKSRWADESFLYSRQSRSAIFNQGLSSEFQVTVYRGEEYYVSVKGDIKLGELRIRIKEENRNVLYDNTDYNYEDYFYFKNENTRNLIFEVSSTADKKFSNTTERYCVGVLIQFRDYVEE